MKLLLNFYLLFCFQQIQQQSLQFLATIQASSNSNSNSYSTSVEPILDELANGITAVDGDNLSTLRRPTSVLRSPWSEFLRP